MQLFFVFSPIFGPGTADSDSVYKHACISYSLFSFLLSLNFRHIDPIVKHILMKS